MNSKKQTPPLKAGYFSVMLRFTSEESLQRVRTAAAMRGFSMNKFICAVSEAAAEKVLAAPDDLIASAALPPVLQVSAE